MGDQRRAMRAVAVYHHHPPRCFGVGFRDSEAALAHHTARDDASALALAECVASTAAAQCGFSQIVS